MAKEVKKKMTEKDKEDWKKLYDYIKYDILGYPSNIQLPKMLVLKLKGLERGQDVANNNCNLNASYGYDIILLTFKLKRNDILKSFKYKNFKTEQAKINYMMAIIQNSINDVYLSIQQIKQQEQNIESIDYEISYNKAEYKSSNDGKEIDLESINNKEYNSIDDVDLDDEWTF